MENIQTPNTGGDFPLWSTGYQVSSREF